MSSFLFQTRHNGVLHNIHKGVTGERFERMLTLMDWAIKYGINDSDVKRELENNKSTNEYELKFLKVLRVAGEGGTENIALKQEIETLKNGIREKDEQISDLVNAQNEFLRSLYASQGKSFTPIKSSRAQNLQRK